MFLWLLKIIGIWLLLVVVAILNGGFRDKLLSQWIGAWALPVSGLILSLLIFLITLAVIPWLSVSQPFNYLIIGSIWVGLTLGFEFIFGHWVAGKSWAEILMIFDIKHGNLMALVFLTTWLAPYFAAQFRSLVNF